MTGSGFRFRHPHFQHFVKGVVNGKVLYRELRVHVAFSGPELSDPGLCEELMDYVLSCGNFGRKKDHGNFGKTQCY